MAGDLAVGRGHPLKIQFIDRERRVVGRLLAERKALLIETTGDTTQPDAVRRAGSNELLVVASMLRKLGHQDAPALGPATVLHGERSTRRSDTQSGGRVAA